MNKQLPEDILSQARPEERAALEATWDALDSALPEPASRRMHRRFRRMIRRERFGRWSWIPKAAGMAAMLLIGAVLGQHFASDGQSSPDLELEARMLATKTGSLQLQAIINLRKAEAHLPASAVDRLAELLESESATVGMRLAALDALAAHSDQPAVEAVLQRLRAKNGQNPMIEARLLEAHEHGRKMSI